MALLLGTLSLLLLLPACGGGDTGGEVLTPPTQPSVSVIAPAPEPEPEPEAPLPYVNPLTGEGCATDISGRRPIAIMLNNLKKALPQLGVSQADIIYECPAEGGITRMLAVFQSVDDVGNIGTVRSARDYYVSLAAGMDAVYLHAGGSDGAYLAIKKLGVTALDCVNGPYEGTLYWRDPDRRKHAGMEHSVLTSGETISRLLPTYQRIRTEHESGYTYPMTFAPVDAPASGEDAATITVKFSNYKTGVFRYDSQSGRYLVEEYGAPYVDGNTNEQVSVRNVLVLFTDVNQIPGDTAGRLSVRTTGTGTGWFARDGKLQEITWSKQSETSPMTYQTKDGQSLQFGVGSSYINVLSKSAAVSYEG